MYILIILAFISAALKSLALWKGWRGLEFFVKPAVMVCLFIWLYATAGLQGALLWFGIGILFSLAGDIALMFIDRFFIVGLVAFLLGHVAYLIRFRIPSPTGNFILEHRFRHRDRHGLGQVAAPDPLGSLRAKGQNRLVDPLIIYGVVITLMLLAAMQTLFRLDWNATAALLVSFGAALFYF